MLTNFIWSLSELIDHKYLISELIEHKYLISLFTDD